MAEAELCWNREDDHNYYSWGQENLSDFTPAGSLLKGQKGKGCFPLVKWSEVKSLSHAQLFVPRGL